MEFLTLLSAPSYDCGAGLWVAVLGAVAWMLTAGLWLLARARRVVGAVRSGESTLAELPSRRWPDPVPPKPLYAPVPPRWYREEYMAVHVALAEGRTVIARAWACGLVDDSVIGFGPDHPYTRDAWELTARVVRTALAAIPDPGVLDAAPADDPVTALLFPRGTAFDADGASVYVSTGRESRAAVVR